MIAITANRPTFSRQFGQVLARAKNPTAILMVAGRELHNVLRKHFREKDRTDINKLAPNRRQHFWLQVMRSVNNPVQSGYNQVSVRVSDPRIAQKVFGGLIKAKRSKLLTIPASPEAYGRTAETFERETGRKLFLIKVGGTKANASSSLVLASAMGNHRFQVEYNLTPRVKQDKDPTALPSEEEMEKSILARAQKAADRQQKVES